MSSQKSDCRADSERSSIGRRMVLHPDRLHLPDNARAVTVAVGNYHTLLTSSDGALYTFGSNCHGQLGLGDIKRRVTVSRVPLPSRVMGVAAGANHTVVITDDGAAHTFGSGKKGQLGRRVPDTPANDKYWNTAPGRVNEEMPTTLTAVAIAAGADVTFVQCTEQAISSEQLDTAQCTTNGHVLMIFPSTSDDYIVVNVNE